MDKDPDATGRISRRRFLRDVGAATVVAADTLNPALARAQRSRQFSASTASTRPTAAVFGGGIAGLTAAHELAERGFEVTVYERRAWGGKARSTEVPGSATAGRRPLPGEHAYRVPFGFYQNLPDTMRRIPFESNPRGVFDNLVAAPQVAFMRAAKHNLVLPLGSVDARPYTPQQILDLVVGVLVDMELPPLAAAHFATRLAVFFSSCDARRLGPWESTSWLDFIGANNYGEDYRKVLGAVPLFTQASKAENTSAEYIATFFELLIYSLLGLGSNGPAVRVLDQPTNEAWIDPWVALLQTLGTRLLLNYELTGFETSNGRISAAHVQTPGGAQRVVADWYVCALPVEVARSFWSTDILALDPSLARMQNLGTAWMNGVMFYLRQQSQIVTGHGLCADSPWAASFIPQAQFWRGDFATRYGDGTVHDKLSVAIADWTQPGVVFGKAAQDCTPDEVVADLWEQLKRHINKPNQTPRLTDAMLHSSNIDPGMLLVNNRLISADPLVLPTAGTRRYRPDVTTAIPNLMLCGDYIKGNWIITTMEAANESGRLAANAILAGAGRQDTPATVTDPYRPPEWEPLRQIDARRFANGQPNLLDLPVEGALTQQVQQLIPKLDLGPPIQPLGLLVF